MDRKSGYIMLSVAAGALLAGVIDAVVRPGYLAKSLLKLAFFFLLPMAFFLRLSGVVSLSKKGAFAVFGAGGRGLWGDFGGLFSDPEFH